MTRCCCFSFVFWGVEVGVWCTLRRDVNFCSGDVQKKKHTPNEKPRPTIVNTELSNFDTKENGSLPGDTSGLGGGFPYSLSTNNSDSESFVAFRLEAACAWCPPLSEELFNLESAPGWRVISRKLPERRIPFGRIVYLALVQRPSLNFACSAAAATAARQYNAVRDGHSSHACRNGVLQYAIAQQMCSKGKITLGFAYYVAHYVATVG